MQELLGRDVELARLHDLLTGPGGALILRGGPGAGKTALLEQAAGRASGRVVQAAGAEAETPLPYAGLNQVIYPLAGELRRLETDQAEPLRAVLEGAATERPPGVLQLAVGLLDLLAVAAGDRTLLLVIDDAHWLDALSAEVLAVAGRRLSGTNVHLLLATRDDLPSPFDTVGLPEVVVGPLGEEASAHLIARLHPALPAGTRDHLLREAAGNALALVELPRGNASGTPDGVAVTLALPRRLERIYAERLQRLPATERQELLRAGLDGATAGRSDARAGGIRYPVPDAPVAVREHLVRLDPASGAWTFAHPLVRAAVVSSATQRERHAAHLHLARWHVHDPRRRALHLAAGTVDPDEQTAAVLEAAATMATAHGATGTAVQLLQRAAELSEDAVARSRRLADASFLAGQAGLLRQAETLAERSEGDLAALVTAAYVGLYRDGDVTSAPRLVLAALEADDLKVEPVLLERAVNLLIAAGQFSLDPGTWRRIEQVVDRQADSLPATTLLYRDTWGDVVRRGHGVGPRLDAAFVALGSGEPWDVMRLGVAAYYVDALPRYRSYVQRMVDREDEAGAVGNVMTMLQLVMLEQLDTGQWDEAEATGRRGLALTEHHGYQLFGHQFRAFLAHLAAARGRVPQAQELLGQVERWARPRGVGFLIEWVESVNALLAAGRGDYEAAWLYAGGVTEAGTYRPYSHLAARSLWATVEAALHTGRDEAAAAHVRAASDLGLGEVSGRLAMLTDAAHAATLESAETSDVLFRRASTAAAADEYPFDGARVRLAHGMWLRRQRRTTEAREMLTRALDTFTALGADAWQERTRQELRAAGTAARLPDATATLTAQERQVAELAAQGLSNKEIGARLFLSPRTVGAHLYRAYPKLGITSRASLRDALGAS